MFARAVVVDSALVWARRRSWVSVDELVAVLLFKSFSVPSLASIVQNPAVAKHLLLLGALEFWAVC